VLARLALSWLVNTAVLALVTWMFSSITYGGSAGTLVIAGAVFGILNTLLKPILKFLTFPLAIFTLGLAWFGVAMFMLWLTDVIVPSFDVHGFWTYVGATIVIWLANLALDLFLARNDPRGRGTINVTVTRTRRPPDGGAGG
jgi:putative membrane protein